MGTKYTNIMASQPTPQKVTYLLPVNKVLLLIRAYENHWFPLSNQALLHPSLWQGGTLGGGTLTGHEWRNSPWVAINWLVVEPTHLKNMLVKMGSSSPKFGMKIPNIFELPPSCGMWWFFRITIIIIISLKTSRAIWWSFINKQSLVGGFNPFEKY